MHDKGDHHVLASLGLPNVHMYMHVAGASTTVSQYQNEERDDTLTTCTTVQQYEVVDVYACGDVQRCFEAR